MEDNKYKRLVQTSVTCFLHHNDEYLFLKRNLNKRIDPGRLNGIGGRLEPSENYLDAAIRETEEETGYIVTPENVKFCGVIKLEGGYAEDWVMCFFKIEVDSKNIPLGNVTEDGELLWIKKDEILTTEYELVDDLNYCIPEVVSEKEFFFITANVGNNGKIIKANVSKLPKLKEY